MLAARHGGWIVVLEIFHARAPEHLPELSATGAALTVRWLLHRPTMLAYAEAGRPIAGPGGWPRFRAAGR